MIALVGNVTLLVLKCEVCACNLHHFSIIRRKLARGRKKDISTPPIIMPARTDRPDKIFSNRTLLFVIIVIVVVVHSAQRKTHTID